MRRILTALVATTLLAGCGGGRPANPAIGVTVRDFQIDAPASVRAGDVRLAVHNRGPSTHEVLVVKAATSHLPLRRDGITVDEDALEDAEAGEVEGAQPGTTRTRTFHLTPGRYELVCNMAGHYRGGMHATLVVR